MGAAGWERDLDWQLSALVGNERGAARIQHIVSGRQEAVMMRAKQAPVKIRESVRRP